jgi:hypothetical protein
LSDRLGPTHPITRLGRVTQQLRSFLTLHGNELDSLAGEIEAGGQVELATRLRTLRSIQADETQLVIDEVVDIAEESMRAESELAEQAQLATATAEPASSESAMTPSADPAANSPKRARWVAEEAAKREVRPLSRRAMLRKPLSS